MSSLNQYIIGLSGHIDHGKTSLVKLLTGKNTDSLKEEIDRGKVSPGSTGISTSSIVRTSGISTSITGYGTTTNYYYENSNFIQLPDHVTGVDHIKC